MNFLQSFRLAIKSLLTSKMRALLTMLGIIIRKVRRKPDSSSTIWYERKFPQYFAR